MENKGNMYYAAEGSLIVRTSDGKIMGDAICLAESDSIDNYAEQKFSEEEINDFWDSLGIPRPVKKEEPKKRKKKQ